MWCAGMVFKFIYLRGIKSTLQYQKENKKTSIAHDDYSNYDENSNFNFEIL